LAEGIQLTKRPEMSALVAGLNFLLLHSFSHEIFSYKSAVLGPTDVDPKATALFPYLLCNIGSGTSILKVTGKGGEYERIGGSTIGGGTYLGLCKLLTNLTTFEEIADLEKDGRVASVDLLVRDIYGEAKSEALGLSPDIIASSFGKIGVTPSIGIVRNHSNEDICRSLLVMICNTLGQIAVLTARLEGIRAVYFSGGFLREKGYVWEKLQHAVNYWSHGNLEARFIVHDSYLGGIGALLDEDGQDAPRTNKNRRSSFSIS
jgi:pantothenate kinase